MYQLLTFDTDTPPWRVLRLSGFSVRGDVGVCLDQRSHSRAALMLNFLRAGSGVFSATWQVPASLDAAQQRVDHAWFAGAELVRLELEALGPFERPLQAEFVLRKEAYGN